MKKTPIDCFFIGYNETEFPVYEKNVRTMGTDTAAYRDLNLNFLQYNNLPRTITDFYNLFHYGTNDLDSTGPLAFGNVFSLTIAYLATYLHRHGFSFDYVNSFQDHRAELAEQLQTREILSVAIPTTLYVIPLPILEIINFIRKYNERVKIIVGGPFISYQARVNDQTTLQYLYKSLNADFYVNSNQGEATLVKLLNALKNKMSFERIDNLIYQDRGRYFINPQATEDNKLEENMVDWNLFSDRMSKYAAVRTALSCPFKCKYCSFPAHAGKYQTMDVTMVERDLNALAALKKITSLNFIDDTFNIPVGRFKEMLRMMIKNRYQFKWNSFFRCQFADRETVELMKESGCEGVILGIESGNEQILKNMNKTATLDQYRKGINLLKEYDIITYTSYIVGFPGETRETVQDTIDFIEENQPDFFRPELWYCNPLSPIYQEKEEYQIENSQFDWSHATMNVHEACDLLQEMFLSIKKSLWAPYHNFDIEGVYYLLHRGKSLQQIREFINAFNTGVKEKLINPNQKEVNSQTVQKLQNAFRNDQDLPPVKKLEDVVDKYEADFNF